jgi:hypothetical protein
MADAIKVHVYDDAALLGTVNVSSGNWSKTGQSLAAGDHKVKGKAEDVAGNIGSFSSIKYIRTGDATTPTCDLLDDSGQSSSDNITNDNTPQIKAIIDFTAVPGTANAIPNSSVKKMKLYEKVAGPTYNLLLEQATMNAKAYDEIISATFQIVTALSDGVHILVASWVDQKDNESAKGAELSITIDTAAPNAPAITNIQDGQVFIGTSIDISGTAT